MKHSGVTAMPPASAIREQLELVRQSITSFDQQIKLTDEMITGLAILREGVQTLPWFTATEEAEREAARDPARCIQDGLTILLTNWGRRLQLDKQQLEANKTYNENLVRMAESGIVIPR